MTTRDAPAFLIDVFLAAPPAVGRALSWLTGA
jgi:hypothetical protein